MTGFHEVKVFVFRMNTKQAVLPDGWKPFSADFNEGVLTIIARKWHRRAAPSTDRAFPTGGSPGRRLKR